MLHCIANEIIPQQEFGVRIVCAYIKISSISDPQNSGRASIRQNTHLHVPGKVRKCDSGHEVGTRKTQSNKCAACKNNVRKQCTKCKIVQLLKYFFAWQQQIFNVQTRNKTDNLAILLTNRCFLSFLWAPSTCFTVKISLKAIHQNFCFCCHFCPFETVF